MLLQVRCDKYYLSCLFVCLLRGGKQSVVHGRSHISYRVINSCMHFSFPSHLQQTFDLLKSKCSTSSITRMAKSIWS